MIRRLTSTFLILTISVTNLFSQYEKQINDFKSSPLLKHATIGFCIKDNNGNTIASLNPEQSYTPASILKVITTASALEILGANYKYETTVEINNSLQIPQIIIRGAGDPTLGSEFLDNTPNGFISIWNNKISSALAEKKNISIYVVDNLFGYQGISRKWIYEDIGNYYGGAAYGISIFDNTYRLSFNTEDISSTPKIIEVLPSMKNIKFSNTLMLNTTGRDNGYIVGSPFSNERTIIGNIPAGRKKFTIKGAIPNPGLYLGEVIAESLRSKGINTDAIKTSQSAYVANIYDKKNDDDKGTLIHKHISPPLSSIIKDVNVRSNNHYAEHLIRTIGAKCRKDFYESALDEGIKGIKYYWNARGINTNSLFMYDGSGLAPTNALSASFMCDILGYMQSKSKNAQTFLNSFPLAGREGTVRNFLKGTRLEGKVSVKSGSIANVQCFAGYYIDGEKKYTFTIMVNKFDGTSRQAIQAIEKLLLATLQ